MTPNKHRKKHRHCSVCKYWKGYLGDPLGCCKVKGVLKWDTSGRFCRVYKPKEFEL